MPSANFDHGFIAIMRARFIAVALIASWLGACDAQTPPTTVMDPESVAKQLVAEFLSVPATEIILVSLNAQEFNDSSLDCPEPGMSYLQVLTPGHRVIVEAEGRRFDVRVSAGHGRICRRHKSKTLPGESSMRSTVSSLIDLARQDLARTLETDVASISVLEVQPFNAETVAKGCSPECSDGDRRCGYMIGFLHDGRRYVYHADQEQVAPCPPILTM